MVGFPRGYELETSSGHVAEPDDMQEEERIKRYSFSLFLWRKTLSLWSCVLDFGIFVWTFLSEDPKKKKKKSNYEKLQHLTPFRDWNDNFKAPDLGVCQILDRGSSTYNIMLKHVCIPKNKAKKTTPWTLHVTMLPTTSSCCLAQVLEKDADEYFWFVFHPGTRNTQLTLIPDVCTVLSVYMPVQCS